MGLGKKEAKLWCNAKFTGGQLAPSLGELWGQHISHFLVFLTKKPGAGLFVHIPQSLVKGLGQSGSWGEVYTSCKGLTSSITPHCNEFFQPRLCQKETWLSYEKLSLFSPVYVEFCSQRSRSEPYFAVMASLFSVKLHQSLRLPSHGPDPLECAADGAF